ncbi:MAG: LolA family protein [Bacteroidia bacterium]
MRYLLLGAFFLLAQNDPRAQNIIKKTRKKLKKTEFMTVRFSYSLENTSDKKNAKLQKEGLLKYKPAQNKFHIELGDIAVISDGKNVWQFLKEEKEVNLSRYNPKESFSLERIFRIYDEDMKVRYDGVEWLAGQKTNKITLFPLSDTTLYFRVEIWTSEASDLPLRMRISNRNGTIMDYVLKSYDFRPIAENEFVFDKERHTDVEIIDLR